MSPQKGRTKKRAPASEHEKKRARSKPRADQTRVFAYAIGEAAASKLAQHENSAKAEILSGDAHPKTGNTIEVELRAIMPDLPDLPV
jgi:hypothetical protein